MRRLALTKHGDITYCESTEENLGKGRCNHVSHQKESESQEEFLENVKDFKFVFKKDLIETNNKDAQVIIGGSQNKWWSKDYKYMYKTDINDPTRGLIQFNGLSEELSYQFLSLIGADCAEYETTFIEGKLGCRTKNLLEEGESLLEFGEILNIEDMEYLTDIENDNLDEKLNYLCEKIKSKTGRCFKNDIIKLIKLDIVLMNADRHYGNIALIQTKDGEFKFSTLYDQGQCLLAENIFKNVDAYGDGKLNLPGLNMFGMFPMSYYVEFAIKNSNAENEIKINLDQIESFISGYKNRCYNEDKVEKAKWLLWDNVDFYSEVGVLKNVD